MYMYMYVVKVHPGLALDHDQAGQGLRTRQALAQGARRSTIILLILIDTSNNYWYTNTTNTTNTQATTNNTNNSNTDTSSD